MLEKRKEYINLLLSDLKALQDRVVTVSNNDSLPFSFFRESFDKIQEIYKTLHLLEYLQIDDMRGQMERLVHFLSEAESRENNKQPEETRQQAESEIKDDEPYVITEKNVDDEPDDIAMEEKKEIGLPEYKNPKFYEVLQDEQNSINDVMPAKQAVNDLKRNLSLNDRFIFQRELFKNNRQEMEVAMETIGKFENYSQAEQYLNETFSLDMESPAVNDFLQIVKKGFE